MITNKLAFEIWDRTGLLLTEREYEDEKIKGLAEEANRLYQEQVQISERLRKRFQELGVYKERDENEYPY